MNTILNIYKAIQRNDNLILNANNYSDYQLKKFASMTLHYQGKMILKNSNNISKLTLNYLSNISKKKIIFDFS